MISFPFFRFPYSNYRYYNNYNPYYNKNDALLVNNSNEDNSENSNTENKYTKNQYKKKSSKYNSFGPINLNFSSFNNIEEPLLEILGIKLYLDDIIILGLLFFLYNEGVKDDILFITLILLLLS